MICERVCCGIIGSSIRGDVEHHGSACIVLAIENLAHLQLSDMKLSLSLKKRSENSQVADFSARLVSGDDENLRMTSNEAGESLLLHTFDIHPKQAINLEIQVEPDSLNQVRKYASFLIQSGDLYLIYSSILPSTMVV